MQKKIVCFYNQFLDSWHLPELGEFWLPRDDVRGGCGPVGGLPFLGLPGGNVSKQNIEFLKSRKINSIENFHLMTHLMKQLEESW